MGKIYDVSIPVCEGMPLFPGDEKFYSISQVLSVENGDPYSLKKMTILTHTGTHVDVPSHFIPYGKNLEQIDLNKFIGQADVIEIQDQQCVSLGEVKDFPFESGTIVLFKTINSYLWKENKDFEENYVYITPEVAKLLVDKNIKSVGLDYLSADKYDASAEPEVHMILLGNDIPIIEGLDLSEVPPGRYKFYCLPLKLIGTDGSPVRAILEELD